MIQPPTSCTESTNAHGATKKKRPHFAHILQVVYIQRVDVALLS